MRRVPNKSMRREKAIRPLSDEDVGRFLKNLAAIYRDKKLGNTLLAEALLRVAGGLIGQKAASSSSADKDIAVTGDEPRLLLDAPASTNLVPTKAMSATEVSRMITDASRTKQQLIELAAVRFSIPRSKLLRLTVDDVRETIRSALMHEGSITAISEAAEKYGSRRHS